MIHDNLNVSGFQTELESIVVDSGAHYNIGTLQNFPVYNPNFPAVEQRWSCCPGEKTYHLPVVLWHLCCRTSSRSSGAIYFLAFKQQFSERLISMHPLVALQLLTLCCPLFWMKHHVTLYSLRIIAFTTTSFFDSTSWHTTCGMGLTLSGQEAISCYSQTSWTALPHLYTTFCMHRF